MVRYKERDSVAIANTRFFSAKQASLCTCRVDTTDATNVFSLLESSRKQASADGAYLYRFASDGATAHLVLEAGLSVGPGPGGVRVAGRSASPVVVTGRAWADPRFERLPEFPEHRFEGVVSIPLVYGGAVFGFVNVCRSHAASAKPSELANLVSLGAAIAALLAHEE